MIRTCLRCGGLYADEPTNIAGKICQCARPSADGAEVRRAYERGFAKGSGDEGWYQRRISQLEGIIAEVDKIAELCPMSATTRRRLVKMVMSADSNAPTVTVCKP